MLNTAVPKARQFIAGSLKKSDQRVVFEKPWGVLSGSNMITNSVFKVSAASYSLTGFQKASKGEAPWMFDNASRAQLG